MDFLDLCIYFMYLSKNDDENFTSWNNLALVLNLTDNSSMYL